MYATCRMSQSAASQEKESSENRAFAPRYWKNVRSWLTVSLMTAVKEVTPSRPTSETSTPSFFISPRAKSPPSSVPTSPRAATSVSGMRRLRSMPTLQTAPPTDLPMPSRMVVSCPRSG